MSHLLAGIGLGFSLIVAIGAQNLFVLRQGLRRERAVLVATICAVSDAILIVVGVSGIGAATTALPWLVDVVRWAGAVFLVGYGLLAARRALRPDGSALVLAPERTELVGADAALAAPGSTSWGSGAAGSEGGASTHASSTSGGSLGAASTASGSTARESSAKLAAAHPRSSTSVALTCLALTWLNPHVYLDTVFLLGSVAATHGEQRWIFAAGAMLASLTWFFGLAFGARLLGRLLATVRAWQVLDAVIAVVMVGLGVSLVLPA